MCLCCHQWRETPFYLQGARVARPLKACALLPNGSSLKPSSCTQWQYDFSQILSLCFCFLICKMEMLSRQTSLGVWHSRGHIYKVLRTALNTGNARCVFAVILHSIIPWPPSWAAQAPTPFHGFQGKALSALLGAEQRVWSERLGFSWVQNQLHSLQHCWLSLCACPGSLSLGWFSFKSGHLCRWTCQPLSPPPYSCRPIRLWEPWAGNCSICRSGPTSQAPTHQGGPTLESTMAYTLGDLGFKPQILPQGSSKTTPKGRFQISACLEILCCNDEEHEPWNPGWSHLPLPEWHLDKFTLPPISPSLK